MTRRGFAGVVSSAFLGMGFSRDAALHEFPMEMFLAGSDLRPLEVNADRIVEGLTRWKPQAAGRPVRAADRVTIEGKDHLDAIEKMNLLFLKNRWGDGLPLLPATEERVAWLLTGTDLPRNRVVGRIPVTGRAADVEALAVNLSMTGGRPEYMPVLIAAVEAYANPAQHPEKSQATTCAVNPVVIVSGPAGRQIRLNSGYGCLGPDPVHPAGGSIGRALRLVQQNVGGAIPGSGTMSIFGGPARYTNIVFAEDEEGLPPGWGSLAEDRGFPAGSNVVTVHEVASATNLTGVQASTGELALETLNMFARIMGGDRCNIFTNYGPDSAPGVAIMPRGIARGLAALGWSKDKVKEFLWANSKVPLSVVRADTEVYRRAEETMRSYAAPGGDWPIAASPGNMLLAVAGGEQSGHGYWMRVGCCPLAPASAEIRLPMDWAKLLNRADEDLGPV